MPAEIQTCPRCQQKFLPSGDGHCPGCRSSAPASQASGTPLFSNDRDPIGLGTTAPASLFKHCGLLLLSSAVYFLGAKVSSPSVAAITAVIVCGILVVITRLWLISTVDDAGPLAGLACFFVPFLLTYFSLSHWHVARVAYLYHHAFICLFVASCFWASSFS